MKNENDVTKICANPGCGRPAEDDGALCDSCALEWSLFHREIRGEDDLRVGVPPAPAPSDNALPVS